MKKKSTLLNTQFLTSVISTTLVLVLLGTIVMFVLTARNLSDYVRENINVSILLSDDLSAGKGRELGKRLGRERYIKEVKYISKEQALREEVKAMGTDPTEFIGYNPYTASLEVKMNAEYANADSMRWIIPELKDNKAVMDVIYQKDLIDSVNRNISKVGLVLLIIAALLTYISFSLINSTVKLSIFARRFLINTMKLVGAPWSFIRRPFVIQSFVLGLISSLVSIAILTAGVLLIYQYEPQFVSVIGIQEAIITGIAVLVFGILITMLCTTLSLNRYLRMSTNDLYRL